MSDKLAPENLVSTSSMTRDRVAAARILARSFYKELRSSGYTANDLIALSTALIELITLDLQKHRQDLSCAA